MKIIMGFIIIVFMTIPDREPVPHVDRDPVPLLERYRRPVDTYMQGLLAGVAGSPARMVEYHLGFRNQEGAVVPGGKSDGKAIRPTLCLLTADATGGEWEKAIPAASAIELFHNFTLIHDDVQDDDKTRHGKPTVWAMWGKEQAINGGNVASFLSNQALSDLEITGHPAETVLKANNLLRDVGIQVINGQAMDIDFEGRLDVTTPEYLTMIRGKTGVLIEGSIAMGALLGSADDQTTALLREYGRESGLAFQIIDDGLGIWGDPEKTGKPVGSDIRKRKNSYPIVHAFNTTEGHTKEQLEVIYRQEGEMHDTDVARVMEILDDVGSKEQTRAVGSQALEKAVTAIDQTDIGEEFKNDYRQLAETFANRQH